MTDPITNIGIDAAITAGTIHLWRSSDLRAMREIEHGEPDDRERQRRDQPVEDQNHRADDRHDGVRPEQRAAVGRRRRDHRERHQRRGRAARAEHDEHAARRRGTRSSATAVRDAGGAKRSTADRPFAQIARLLDRPRRASCRPPPVTSRFSVSPGAICCTSRQTRSASAALEPSRGRCASRARDAADAIALANAGAVGGPPGNTRVTVTRSPTASVTSEGE